MSFLTRKTRTLPRVLALVAAALWFPAAHAATPLVIESFLDTEIGRQSGQTLDGLVSEIGGRTWSANTNLVLGNDELTNVGHPWMRANAGVPFNPAASAPFAKVGLRGDPSTVNWIGVGFARSATGAFWDDGTVWAFLRDNGQLVVQASGVQYALYRSAVPAPGFAPGVNDLRLEYDRVGHGVRVWLNGVEQPLTIPDLDSLGYLPPTTHAGFHVHKVGSLTTSGLVHVDDFFLSVDSVTTKAAACITGGDQSKIQNALVGAGAVAELCANAEFTIAETIRFTAPNQVIRTKGLPTDGSRALLRMTPAPGSLVSMAIDGLYRDGAEVRNVEVDGARPLYGWTDPLQGALVRMGGVHGRQVLDGIRAYHPRSWSTLMVAGSADCSGAVLTNNDIGPAGAPALSLPAVEQADGISLSCTQSYVANNFITDATDGGIVIFGSAGSTIEHNTVVASFNKLLGGIVMVDFKPSDGDFTGTVVRDNVVRSDGAFIATGFSMGPRIWFCPIEEESEVSGGSVLNNRVEGSSVGYGFVVDGVKNWTVAGNVSAAYYEGTPNPLCGVPVSGPRAFLKHAVHSKGSFQPEFVEGSADGVIGIRQPDIVEECFLPVGHEDYCAVCGPCAAGEADCDNDGQCQPGLVCKADVGPLYGYPATWDVCDVYAGPPTPAGLVASDGDLTTGVSVTWNATPGATAYRVHRAPEASPTQFVALPEMVTTNSFLDRTVLPGARYVYAVSALVGGTETVRSTSDLGWRASFNHGVIDLNPTADAFVTQNDPDKNWGEVFALRVRHFATGLARYSFIEFNVPTLAAKVRSATLRLRPQDRTIPEVSVYDVNNLNWTETGITWNNWTIGSEAILLYKTWPVEPNGDVVLDVTSALSGAGKVTIGLATDYDLDELDFWAHESLTPAYRPLLQVVYAP